MRYFVIGADGNRYGPADVQTLQQWLSEGRLNDQSWLEEEVSGNRVQAHIVLHPQHQGQQPPQQPYAQQNYTQPPSPHSPYPRGYVAPTSSNNAQTQIVIGWVCAVLSLFCCPLGFGIAAIVLGALAKGKGHKGAVALIVSAIILMILGMVIGVVTSLNQNQILRQILGQ